MKNYTNFDSLPITLSVSDVANVLGISRVGAYNLCHVQSRLTDTTEAITNSTGYLVSCIYNSVADEAITRIRSGC